MVESRFAVPIVNRPVIRAISKRIKVTFSPWSGDFFLLQDWWRE